MPPNNAPVSAGPTRRTRAPSAGRARKVNPAAEAGPPVPLGVIAKRAGVSRMAVSLALRGSPSISPQAKKRVQAIARRLGYRPDPLVSLLMSNLRRAGRTRNIATIGIVTNVHGGLSWQDIATHRAYFEGARERSDALGYRVEEFRLSHDGMNEHRAIQVMQSRGVEGAVIFPTLNRIGAFEFKADLSQFSCATIAYSLQAPRLHRSCVHHFRVAMEACEQLHRLGYRRLVLVLDKNQDRRSGHNWRAGFLTAENLHHRRAAVPPLIPAKLTFSVFSNWLRHHQPDAILHIPDHNEGVEPIFDWLNRCGARVPEDIGYACLDLAPTMVAEISGMEQRSKLVGAAAIDLVISGLRQNERGIPSHANTTMIDGVWRPGRSTRERG